MNEPYKYKICYNTDTNNADNVYNGHGKFYKKDTYDEILNDTQFDNIYVLKIYQNHFQPQDYLAWHLKPHLYKIK